VQEGSSEGDDTGTGARDHLPTELVNERTRNLDDVSTADALELLTTEDEVAVAAVRKAHPALEQVIDLATERLGRGGRMFYVGAGTSGRLGTLDAAECPPTFSSAPEQVQALIAGGKDALIRAVEGAEDDPDAASLELFARKLTPTDLVIGIAAGGTTPYVHGAIAYARSIGAATAFLACVPFAAVPDEADISIRLDTGPEPLAGSTRMKAGTATKLALNAISTLTMVRLGKVHGNRMVDVQARGNTKLVERATSLVAELAGVDRELARQLLWSANWQVKTAVVMHQKGLDAAAATKLLAKVGGFLREALK
jgi:N-acetylmuramic acid 6-phosphate etherase